MDPRLHPQLNPSQPSAPVAAVSPPPAPTQAPPQPQPVQAPVPAPAVPAVQKPLAQIVGTIPVRQPGSQTQAAAAAEPTQQMPGTTAPKPDAEPAKPHDDLDKILQAVNNRVATPPPAHSKPKKEIVKKIADKAAKVKPAGQNSKPIGLTVAVILVALVLSFLAFRAYRQTGAAASISSQPGKVGTSYTASGAIQSAGGTLVRPSDLDDYSQTLQSQLNSLNDSQDFAANSLSDQVLGL